MSVDPGRRLAPPRREAPRRAIQRVWPPLRAAALRVWAPLRRYLAGLSVGGRIMGLLFFCFSMTPSLLPREWYFQGIASGICTVTGYAVGVTIGWVLRRFGFHPLANPRHRVIIVRTMWISASVLVPAFGVLGAIWQYQARVMTAMDPTDSNYYALVLLIAFVLARLLLSVARLLRYLTRRIGRFAGRWIPRPVAKLIAAALVTALVATALADVLAPGLLKVANSSFSLADSGTPDGVVRPTAPERSGSPTSLSRWRDLGSEGRRFVGTGPDATEIAAFTGQRALEPIRVYAGLESADTLKAAADLVVAELERTGAFDRAVLLVVTTTGRGWVNNAAASALEYMWGGDTAIAAMQYSYLSSPVAFLSDRETPPVAAKALLNAITHQTAQLDDPPAIIVMGESLGAYGSQAAFGSATDVADRVDGAIWTGTPNMTPLWQQITDRRKPDSPQQLPDIDGCQTVCFISARDQVPSGARPTVVYLQHADDPIVWWSPDLLLRRPQWLAEPPLPGRSRAMTYIPLVTFWQLATDMAVSTSTPDGYGHEYAQIYADAFAAVIPPLGWTRADTARLRTVLADIDTGG